MSSNSRAAASTTEGSAYTAVRGPISRLREVARRRARSGTTARDGRAGTLPSGWAAALITARSPASVATRAVYVTRTPGLSCSGIQLRAWIACDCVYRNGCALPAVCAGSSHCRPDAAGEVE